MSDYMKHLGVIGDADIEALNKARESYGDSWKKRGGVGAYMMLARKIDRLENQCEKHHYDIFAAAAADTRPEGIIDDIRDLRRYLILVEAEIIERRQNSLRVPTIQGRHEYRNAEARVHMDAIRTKTPESCNCGRHAGQPHRYGCATIMGGGDNE